MQKIEALYEKTLPTYGLFKFYSDRRDNEGSDLYNIFDGEEWVGFIYLISSTRMENITLIAIDASGRPKGYGSAVLDLVKELHKGKPIVLLMDTVDPKCEDFEVKQKRKAFYERNGFITRYYGGTTKQPMEMAIYGDDYNLKDYTELNGKLIGGLGGRLFAWMQTKSFTNDIKISVKSNL
ncbi:MAG: GNAT family N-acetyltransferase [Defluviitaleaceae bacterium]|nr:GNAT family N-acetyltransferase [Defluviitaleaceae bacterium]